tara:strand:+ start:1 stop:1002 length:1002 start_codon:yes stop_codon:yes gene_type:complete
MNFRANNLLVTGGAGFIGSNFIEYILDKYQKVNVFNLDLLTYAGNIDNTKPFLRDKRYKFFKGNICDYKLVKSIFNKYNIDGVINFAAESHVDKSIDQPNLFVQTNINGVFNLLKCSYEFWMHSPFVFKENYKNARFHQISTDEIYGSIENGSFSEESKFFPNSPYSASKASADLLVRSFNKTYGLNVSTSVCSNNYGKNQNSEKLIPNIINCMLKNDFVKLYGDGLNVRDWINVLDHCSAVDIIFNKSISGESYNVASGLELTNIQLFDLIYEIFNKQIKIKKKLKFTRDRFGHDRRYSLDYYKIKHNLGWVPKYDLEKKLYELVKNKINSH